MKSIYTYFIALAFIFASCEKKKYPESIVENEALYFSSFKLNGVPVELKAGFDNYYQYSSIQQDSNSLYSFVSELTKKDCKSCPLGLRIQINDYRFSAFNSPIHPDSSLHVGRYPFFEQRKVQAYQVYFNSTFNRVAAAGAQTWDFGDGTTFNGADPIHTYERAGIYRVCLRIQGTNGCVSNICNDVKVNPSGLIVSVSGNATNGTSVSFKPLVFQGQALNYLWSFGDGKTSTQQEPVHVYAYAGGYGVSLKVTDGNGDTTTSLYNAVTKNDLSSCAANFQLVGISPLSTLTEKLGKTIITWTDETGTVYSSSSDKQPSTSFFEILSIEEDGKNENGQPTKKLRVRFDCKLFNGNSAISIENAEATICVAYR